MPDLTTHPLRSLPEDPFVQQSTLASQPVLCRHCDKPFRRHTWRGECIGAFWPDGSDVEPRGTFWTPAQPITREDAAREHFALPVQAFDAEGRAVPFFLPSFSELMGDPEYTMLDFRSGREPDDRERPVSRIERRAMDRQAARPKGTWQRSALRILGLVTVIVAVFALAVIR